MKKAIVLIMMLFVCSIASARDVGFTLWGLTEQNLDSRNNAIIGRVGIQYENIEGFLGSTWRPNYDADSGIDPPQVYSAGALYHWVNLIDTDNPLPWIPDGLVTIADMIGLPDAQMKPYAGGQASINIDQEAGMVSALIGLDIKAAPADKTSLILEAAFNENFYDLDVVPDDWKLNIGFRIEF